MRERSPPPGPATPPGPALPAAPLPRGRRIVTTAEAFPPTAAAFIAEALRRAPGPTVSLALTGGSTPRPVYRRLAGLPGIPWERVRVFFGDERRVPPDHPESNYGLARYELLSRIPVPEDAVHRMEGEGEPSEAAARYAARLPDPVDVLLLGVGADGHVASLFPGAAELEEASARVVPSRSPDPPRGRLTITPPVIRSARRIVVLVAGERKAEAVRRALEGEWAPRDCPAQLARHGAWLLDRAAAARLGHGSR